eukprot:jgi/Psemu1/70131/estExt_Genemark1.C_14450010
MSEIPSSAARVADSSSRYIASLSDSRGRDDTNNDNNNASVHLASIESSAEKEATQEHQQETPPAAVLPDPSPEQQRIVRAIHDGDCVTVKACAGSGKTTCMLQVASSLPSNRRVLIVTYNRSLADDCKARIQKLSMGHRVSCYTIHGLISKVAGKVCNDDHKLIQQLDRWDRGLEPMADLALPLDLVMLDEAQDLRPLFHKTLSHVFGAACRSRSGNRHGIEMDSLQLCLVGDPKQLLYDFPTFGSDKASASFFLQPETHWGRFTGNRTWIQLPLSVSYRLTPSVASFCNLFWGTSMVGGNTASPDRPVEYLMKYPYPNSAGSRYDPDKLSTSFLAKIIEQHGPENVLFLAQSIKNVDLPIRVHVNELMKIKDQQTGLQKYNFHIKESVRGFEGRADWSNKVRVWTFCGSKGCEADVVIVFGFDVFRRPHGLNQIGVALSRARKRLIVVHGKKYVGRECLPMPYYPVLGDVPSGMEQHVVQWGPHDSQLLRFSVPVSETERSEATRWALGRFAESGVIQVDFGSSGNTNSGNVTMPQTATFAQKQVNEVYVASEFNYFSALAETKFLQYGAWETIASTSDGSDRKHNRRIDYETNVRFATTTEDVSALYGEAVTYMLQWETCKFVPNVETVVSNGIIRLHPQAQYTEQEIRESLHLISCEVLTGEDSERLEREFATNGNKRKGVDLIGFMNTRLSLKKKRIFFEGDQATEIFFPVRVIECKSEDDDNQLNEFLPQIRSVYDASSKQPFHWVYLANAVMAFSNYHEKFRQIGTDPDSYESWVNSEALLGGLDRLRKTMQLVSSSSLAANSNVDDDDDDDHHHRNETTAIGNSIVFDGSYSFERELSFDFAKDDCIHEQNNGKTIVGVAGVCDWINEEATKRNMPHRAESKGGCTYNIDLLEIKFVHQLSNIHRLQVLVYCALFVLELNNRRSHETKGTDSGDDDDGGEVDENSVKVNFDIEYCRGMLYNARTEEMEICSVKASDAMDFLLDISQFKYNGKDRKELLPREQSGHKKSTDDDCKDGFRSVHRLKRPKKRLLQKFGKTNETALTIDDCSGDEDKGDDHLTPSVKANNVRSPRSYRLLKRPRKSIEMPYQAGKGTNDDPIFLD